MATSVLGTDRFWRETFERAGRQLAQTLIPIIIASLGDPPRHLYVGAIATAAAASVALTIIKALAGVMPDPLEPWYLQLLDRAVPAAAGTLLGFVSVDATDLASVDWDRAWVAAAAAALLAILAYYITPPTSAVQLPPQPLPPVELPPAGGDPEPPARFPHDPTP